MTLKLLPIYTYQCDWEGCRALESDTSGFGRLPVPDSETNDDYIGDDSWLHIRKHGHFRDYCPDHWHREDGKLAIGNK